MGACSTGLMLLMLHQATVMEERCYLNISDLRLKTFRVMITNDAEFIVVSIRSIFLSPFYALPIPDLPLTSGQPPDALVLTDV